MKRNNTWLKRAAIPALALTAMLAGNETSAASLQASSGAGDSAAVVANCLLGTNPYGDVRGCADNSGLLSNAGPLSSVYSASSATYPTGITTQAWASGTLGTLHGFAESNIPSADAIGHNVQSSAQLRMQDSVVASSSLGTLYNNYKYTVDITGFLTASSKYGIPGPSTTAFGTVILDIRNPTCTPCYINKQFDPSSATPNGIITGTLMSVPINEVLQLDLTLQVNTQVGSNAVGQSAFAQTDYQNTVHFYLDALTPGANTVALSGYNYATPAAAVPEPSAVWLMLSGLTLAGVAVRRRG